MYERYYLTESGERVFLTAEEIAEEDRIQGRKQAFAVRAQAAMVELEAEDRALTAEGLAFRSRVLARALSLSSAAGSAESEGQDGE